MNNLQKWLIVITSFIFALGMLLLGVGTILNSFTGRYPPLEATYAYMHPNSRYDTWTGEIQVKHFRDGKFCWGHGATSLVEDIK